jgi:hypothetical protein
VLICASVSLRLPLVGALVFASFLFVGTFPTSVVETSMASVSVSTLTFCLTVTLALPSNPNHFLKSFHH